MGTGSRALPGLGARWGVGLLALLIAAVMVSLAAVAYPVPLRDIPEVLLHAVFPGVFQAAPDPTAETVVIGLRLPRTVLAAIAGAGLAVSGAAFQTLFRNPLATPDTLGVATGASCGAALAILLGWSGLGIQTLSFLFGIAAVALVTSVSRVPGSNRILMLILSGIVVSALFSALVALIKFAADPESVLPSITFWLMGSLASATWSGILMALPFVTLGTVLLYLYRWKLAALSLPEDEARSLGISVRRLRFTAILASALITSSIVALCGLVGWVGLLIPHAARMLFGGSVRRLIPGSVLLGALFLIAVDAGARMVFDAEIPVSVLTSLIGAPAFIYLLRKTGGVKA